MVARISFRRQHDVSAYLSAFTVSIATVLFVSGCSDESVDQTGPVSAPATSTDVSPTESDGSAQSEPTTVSPDLGPDVDEVAAVEPATAPRTTPVAPVATTSEPAPEADPIVQVTETPARDESPRTEPVPVTAPNTDPAGKLEADLAAFEIPPAWLSSVQPKWDVAKPWKEARQEIRRLLGKGDDASRREGIRLTWDYLQKDDIGDGHEYGMYMFLGHEPLWAIKAYREYVARPDLNYPPYFGIKALASLYADYGLFEEAEAQLKRGLGMSPPDPKWNELRQAEMHDAFGDLYVKWGRTEQATASYSEAARLYPLGKPPYGRHLLPRRVKKVQSKLNLLSMKSLEGTSLSDGEYREAALGYSGDVNLTVRITGGRITDIGVQHQEKIDQNACVLIPQRIVEQQSLQVDGISGATVTKDAIVSGTLRALKKAGLQ